MSKTTEEQLKEFWKRKLSWLLKYWLWKLAGKPRSTAIPLYHEGKLVAYDEFLLNQIGEAYIETFDDEWKSIRRRMYLFDVKVLERVKGRIDE